MPIRRRPLEAERRQVADHAVGGHAEDVHVARLHLDALDAEQARGCGREGEGADLAADGLREDAGVEMGQGQGEGAVAE